VSGVVTSAKTPAATSKDILLNNEDWNKRAQARLS